MRSGPNSAALFWAKKIDIEAPPKHIDKCLLEYIEEFHSDDLRLPDELLEKWRDRFVNSIRSIIREEQSRRHFPRFVFNSASDQHLQGYCFCEPNDSAETIDAKRKRSRQIEYYEYLVRLHYNQFEMFCGALLRLWNCTSVNVTQASADQGVDFYGKVPLGKFLKKTILPESAEEGMFAWIVGQAKKYDISKISTSELRELVGAVQLAKSKVFSTATDPLSELNILTCNPVIYLIATTGQMTSGSHKVLERSGIIGLDGFQLSTILADNEVAVENGQLSWSSFESWFSE